MTNDRSQPCRGPSDLSGVWIDRVHDRRPPKPIILDMESSASPTYGTRECSAYPQRDRDLGLGLLLRRKGKPSGPVRTECAGGIPRSGLGNQGVSLKLAWLDFEQPRPCRLVVRTSHLEPCTNCDIV